MGWDLRRADDVNDGGLIICWATFDPGTPTEHAVILEPLEPCCPWDLNGDGVLNILDLIEFDEICCGPCTDCLSCPADFDCDGDVDGDDRILLVRRIISPTFPPPGCDGTSSAAATDQAAQEMGFADAQGFVDWLSPASEDQAWAASFVFSTLVSQFGEDP